jgi:hypothetical protein
VYGGKEAAAIQKLSEKIQVNRRCFLPPCPPLNPVSSRILPNKKIFYLTEILSVEE